MKKGMKFAAVAGCAVAMTAAMMGGAATSAFAQEAPTAATVTYGKTTNVKVTFNIDNYKAGETNVACTKTSQVGKNVKVVKVKSCSVSKDGKATVTLSVKGINANYGKNNTTTVNPIVVVNGKAYTSKVSAKITCLQAEQKVTAAKSVKKSSVKKGAVSIKLKSTSGKKVTVAKNAKTSFITAKKGASKLVVKKHNCGKKTEKHPIKVKVKVPASKNYKAVSKTVKVTVKMK